jgi:hypothetical protein
MHAVAITAPGGPEVLAVVDRKLVRPDPRGRAVVVF